MSSTQALLERLGKRLATRTEGRETVAPMVEPVTIWAEAYP
jgi:hypothetical protein